MEDAETPPSNSVNLSRKIVAISAGEAHTLALTGDGRVFSWGRGTFGRLGTGKEADELFPVPVEFSSGELLENKLKIVGIATGSYHSLALADDGSVWCWGYNSYGQLGIDGENSSVPRCLDQFLVSSKDGSERKSKVPLKIFSVKAGGMMSFAIDNHGDLWTWGHCRPQQSSSPDDDGFSLINISTPIPVFGFYGHTVVKVACGSEHIVALVSAREIYEGDDNLICYSWGSNCHGQLGLSDKENRSHPQIITTLDHDSPWVVYEVACGAFHTAVLTHKRGPRDSDSQCWTFGLGDNGQLGHGTTQSLLIPEPVKELPKHIFFISLDCGSFHTSVVSITGDVWSWGMKKGLGLCPDVTFTGTDAGDAISPILISYNGLNGPKFMEPVQIVCGAAHTVLVSDNGFKLWSWGRGRSGALGNGNTSDSYAPTLASWPPLSESDEEENQKIKSKNCKGDTEMEIKLSLAMEEMTILRSKLSMMENYANILHGSIFGKPFQEQDVPSSMDFDIAKEWEKMLESADRPKLVRMEMFYRNMLAGVKDKIMKKRIHEIVKECLQSETTSN